MLYLADEFENNQCMKKLTVYLILEYKYTLENFDTFKTKSRTMRRPENQRRGIFAPSN